MKTRKIDITTPGPVMESVDGGEPQPSGPVDVFAEALINRVCRGCGTVRSAERRRIRILSSGEWWGTRIEDAWTGESVKEVYSVMVEETKGEEPAAAVLANYMEPQDGRAFTALCPTCVGKAS